MTRRPPIRRPRARISANARRPRIGSGRNGTAASVNVVPVRLKASCGPSADGPSRLHGRWPSTYEPGSHASWRDDECWAEMCASQRTPRNVLHTTRPVQTRQAPPEFQINQNPETLEHFGCGRKTGASVGPNTCGKQVLRCSSHCFDRGRESFLIFRPISSIGRRWSYGFHTCG